DFGQPRFRRLEVRALLVKLADQIIMPCQHLAADVDLLARQRSEIALGETLYDTLELLKRQLCMSLILIRPANLVVMRHRQVVRRDIEMLAGRMHPQEIIERAD